MKPKPASSPQVRIGTFELDLQAGELHTNGLKIRLQDQPLEILAMLVDRPGEVLSREDLRLKLWPADTFVDFEHGLNRAINKLREAFGDDAAKPRYIETLPRRGYRLIAPVEVVPDGRTQNVVGNVPSQHPAGSLPTSVVVHQGGKEGASRASERRKRRMLTWASGILVALAAALLGYWIARRLPSPRSFDGPNLVRLTTSGKVGEAAISPDGKYVAYVERDSGKDSIWLRQIATASKVMIVPPPARIDGLAFSPDGCDLYYVRFDFERFLEIRPGTRGFQPTVRVV